MSTNHLCTSLFGAPSISITRRNSEKPPFLKRNKNVQASFIFLFLGQNKQCHSDPNLSLVNGKRVSFPLRNSCTRSHFRVSSIKEQFPRNFVLVRPLVSLFKDGLFLVRCSVFVAVMFAVGIFLWYARKKARGFVELQLLPSVCSILSGYIQREIGFGKVLSVSPLGFTVEACSIGPHQEEFSCGEVSTMKIRIRPFASLRRGKIVINAFLSQPIILVSQKEDFSWLGIPESGLHLHRSSEEGIDYRTKTRRVAREESTTHRGKERVKEAREAAEKGYIVPQGSSDCLMSDESQNDSLHSGLPVPSSSFNCTDDIKYCKDNHSPTIWAEYGLSHVDLEKSFGVRSSGHRQKFWSNILPDFMRRGLKGVTWKRVPPISVITAKQRNLERSAAAARAYFQGPPNGKTDEPCSKPKVDSSHGGCEGAEIHGNQLMREAADNAMAIQLRAFDKQCSEDDSRNLSVNNEKKTGAPTDNASAYSMGIGSLDKASNVSIHSDENVKIDGICSGKESGDYKSISLPFALVNDKLSSSENFISGNGAGKSSETAEYLQKNNNSLNQLFDFDNLLNPISATAENSPDGARYLDNGGFHREKFRTFILLHRIIQGWPATLIFNLFRFRLPENQPFFDRFSVQVQKFKSYFAIKAEDVAAELSEVRDEIHAKDIEEVLPVTIDSVYFKGGTLMLLVYGDREPREMVNANGYVKFQNHYSRVHVQLSGDCIGWRTDNTSYNGGQLTTLVFVDTTEQKWHANLKIANLFAPLFERIFDIPILWYEGRATGEVHLCMSKGDIFPNIHGQLELTGLSFQIYDAPSIFSEVTATLCFRGQRVFLHNAGGYFGDAPIEASGDFGINPDNGEFHLMCQVPCVEVNALMKTLKMRPLMFPLAGSVTAIFNCQGPLDAPLFVGSGIVSRKASYTVSTQHPSSASEEAVTKNKEAGAVAAFDRIPFSHVSANFTFNFDNSVVDLYGIRATLLDGGEIRGAGNAWICPEGEVDDTAMDVNFSGKFLFDKVLQRYLAEGVQLMPFKIGEVNGETKLSGPILKPKFDIRWAAPEAEDSFTDARGEIIISHEFITVISSAVAFDLNTKIQTRYLDDCLQLEENLDYRRTMAALIIEAIDLDLRLHGFELASFISTPFDAPRPLHLRATGRFKLQGKVVRPNGSIDGKEPASCGMPYLHMVDGDKARLFGDISLSGIKINQLMLAPHLAGSLSISHDAIKLDAMGRADENLSVDVIGPISQRTDGTSYNNKSLSISLQKGQLKANICYLPQHSANLEVKNLPLDELELASLRGSIQRAEIQLNFQKRRGHGILSVLRPKFSGMVGEALDVAARWSGDVITVEKTILQQASSRYELQGEYVLPGTRDRFYNENKGVALLKRAMAGHLGSVISSMGRWRMRLEVPGAEVSEMLPLARLLSRSTDPAVQSRSKEFFMQSLQSDGFHSESLHDLLQEIQNHYKWSEDNILEDGTLPGLAEFNGHWRGSLDASGGGNGDTMVDFDFNGEDWEWGTYKTQRIIASGAYSNNNGLRLEKLLIQKENATLHADGTLLGPVSNLHFAVLNFPVGLVPTLVQIIESSTSDAVHSVRQVLFPIKGILHMEGDLRGNLTKPECDVQIRLLDGAIGGIDLGRAEIFASVTANSRFLFNAHFEPVIQSGHVHIQGSIPVTYSQDDSADAIENEGDASVGSLRNPIWLKENERGSSDETGEKKGSREKHEEGWNVQLAESLKGLNWNMLDAGEVRINANIKDGGMMLLTALSPYANWLHGLADIDLQVTGSVEQPIVDGSATFHRATVSSPALWKPLTNFGGTVHIISNRICIRSVENRVGRKGKLLLKGNLPLKPSESFATDKIELKCDFLDVRMKNYFSGQVDSQIQIMGSVLQPNISGILKLSHGEAYLPHDKGNGEVANSLASKRTAIPAAGYSRVTASGHLSRFFGSLSGSLHSMWPEPTGKHSNVEKLEVDNANPGIDARLTDLKLILGPELRIVYPLILNFAVSGELELNGIARPQYVKPKGILMFENGDVNLVATQVRLKRDHLNIAKFEPDLGLDPILDLILVGSEWQFRIQSRASSWQDNLIVTSTRSVDQDVLTPSEAARVFESQLAKSLLGVDGQLAFKKLATATLETLMPRIEGKGEFGQARWRLVYAPQIPSLLSVDPTVDPLKSLASYISFGTEVEIQLGKRLMASVVRQMKDSEMAMQWTLIYQLTDRLRVLFQSAPSNRLLFEYSAISQK